METEEVQNLYWSEFANFLKKKYLKGTIQRMEIKIPGLPISLRYSIYSNINTQDLHRINCICVSLFTMNDEGINTLNNLFNKIYKIFSSKSIIVYSEPENTDSGKGIRIIVQNNLINIYDGNDVDWKIAYQWMDKTSKKLLKILIKKVAVLG